MDLFKVLVVLILGFLLYREFFNKKTSKIEKLDINTGAMEITDEKIIFNKPIQFNKFVACEEDINVNKNLYVGTGANKWHMRDTRLGITGKFDFVPGFTPGSTANDNWIRILNYNSKDAGAYFTDGGFAANRSWAGVESWTPKINIRDLTIQQEGDYFVFRNNKAGDKRFAVHRNAYSDIGASSGGRV
jgi:hypothetical protein